MKHKLAIAALVTGIGGFGLAVDNGSTLDRQSREVAGLVGAIAILWAIVNHETAQAAWQSAREGVGAADVEIQSLQAALQNL